MCWPESDGLIRIAQAVAARADRLSRGRDPDQLSRISEAMNLFRSWGTAKGLHPSETHCVARKPSRQTLRFSKSGNPAIEQLYRTHWISSELSEKKREKLAEKASRAPELVAIQPLNGAWMCHRCHGTGSLLVMGEPGPACLSCAGLGDLEFLPAGTRCSHAAPKRRARNMPWWFGSAEAEAAMRGLLVEPGAVEAAQRELDR